MQRFLRMTKRGSRNRDSYVDETSNKWKQRAGRTSGPDTYVPGDLVQTVFKQCVNSTHKERDEIYGGPAILVGLVEAAGLPNVGAKTLPPDVYCTIVALGIDGKEIDKEKRLSRVVSGNDVVWDEVHALGTKSDLSTVSAVRIKVKHFESAFKSEKIGEVDIFLDEGTQLSADANLGHFLDTWIDLPDSDSSADNSTFQFLKRKRTNSNPISTVDQPPEKSYSRSREASVASLEDCASPRTERKSFGAGADWTHTSSSILPRIHVRVLVHRPPPDPVPIAVHVEVVEARGVHAADSTGFSDPYVRVRPKVRLNEQTLDEHNKPAELCTRFETETLDPKWNDALLFSDCDRGTLPGDQLDAFLDKEGAYAQLSQTQNIALANTRYLEFSLFDKDVVSRDDPLGEVVVSFSDLFGDEDSVLSEHTLTNRKWYRIHPTKSMDQSLEGVLGHLRVHITLIFEAQLLPADWQEAIDNVTNETYFFNRKTRCAQWHEPSELTALRSSDGGSKDPTSPTASASRSTQERYRRGSVDALMFLALRRDSGIPDATSLSAIDEAIDEALEDGENKGSPHKTPSSKPSPGMAGVAGQLEPIELPAAAAAQKPKASDAEGEDDEPSFDAEAVNAALATMDPYRIKAAASAEFSNPLKSVAAADGNPDRMKALADALQKERDEKRRAEEAAEAAKVASMTAEEKAEYEATKQRDARRDQRKNRMLQSQMNTYGKNPLSAGRGGKRVAKS